MSLPKGFVRLEYIQSSGTQYVDTKWLPTSTDASIEIEFEFTGFNGGDNDWILGNYRGNTAQAIMLGSQNGASTPLSLWSRSAGYKTFGSNAAVNTRYKIKYSFATGVITLNGSNYTLTTVNYGTTSLALFAGCIGNYFCNGKIYQCTFVQGNTVVRNYVPAKRTSDGEIGLYDLANFTFYPNAGTGKFIAGPEVIVPTVPDAPGNFRVVSESDTEITLTWDAVENAAGYLVRQNGVVISDTQELTVTAEVQLFFYYTFEVSAYNEYGEGERSALSVFCIPDNPMLWLVTDRTEQDVVERNSKGVYTAADLIHVAAAVYTLKKLLEDAGHNVSVLPKPDWTDKDWMDDAGAKQYLADVDELRSKLAVLPTTPQTPESLDRLTYTKANHIEQILLDVYAQYLTMLTTRVAAGTATSGGDYL